MPRKILLADDSLTIQKVVELTFSDSDYDLICVSNGLKAVEALEGEKPDLVLADVVMPEKNGYEVCEAIKSNPATARIPVVLLTGTFEPFDRERAERIGADAIVSKPFDSQQLLSQVEELLSRAPASSGATTAAIPQMRPEPASVAAAPSSAAAPRDEDPFDVGFQAEDFTGAFRAPVPSAPAEKDLFADIGGAQDPDKTVEAIEKEHPELAFGRGPTEPPPAPRPEPSGATSWLEESGSRRRTTRSETEEEKWVPESSPDDAFEFSSPETAAPAFTFETPTASAGDDESAAAQSAPPQEAAASTPVEPAPPTAAPKDREHEEEVVVDVAPGASTSGMSEGPAVAHELESLAKSASIPELARMLTTELSGSGRLTEEEIERVAEKVVQKLSDRVIREIAWEVIPDMAEIVIKQRIRELESGAE